MFARFILLFIATLLFCTQLERLQTRAQLGHTIVASSLPHEYARASHQPPPPPLLPPPRLVVDHQRCAMRVGARALGTDSINRRPTLGGRNRQRRLRRRRQRNRAKSPSAGRRPALCARACARYHSEGGSSGGGGGSSSGGGGGARTISHAAMSPASGRLSPSPPPPPVHRVRAPVNARANIGISRLRCRHRRRRRRFRRRRRRRRCRHCCRGIDDHGGDCETS